MPLPVIPNVFRVAIEWNNTHLSRNAVTVMHFNSSTHSAFPVGQIIDAHATANMWDHTSSATKATGLSVTPLDGITIPAEVPTTQDGRWQGPHADGDIIPAASAIAKFLTASRGRSYRGRAFLPFVAESEQANGVLNSGDVTTMNAAWSTFIAACASDAVFPVVASYVLALATPITSVVIESLLGTQRRRQPRPT
jgi:hypothetical protein